MSNIDGPRRDPRRLFTPSDRTHIASRQHWLCNECDHQLPDTFHVHHVIPWAEGGHTDVENGVAVCPDCHQRAAVRELPAFEPRRWQRAALAKTLPKLRAGEFATTSAAPGAGKTLFGTWVYRQLLDAGDVARVVIFVPNANLRTQWHDEAKALNVFLGIKGTTEKPTYDGVVLTYHALQDPKQFQQVILDADEKPTLFILDEVHHLAQLQGGSAGSWAVNINRIVGTIQRPQHPVLNLSGTLFRSNQYEQISTISYTKLPDGKIETLADYTISAGDLIKEGQLRHLKVLGFDAEMRVDAIDLAKTAHAGAETIRAVDIDDDKIHRSKILPAMIRNERFIKGILRETISRLGHSSTALEGAPVKGLIIADGIEHSEQIYAALTAEIGPRHAFLVHGKISSAEAEIQRFRKSTGQAVMVAVQKVSEGFDVPDICVLTYLRTWRAPLFVNQMVGRAMRITERERKLGAIPATILIPNEAQLKASFADVLVGAMQILAAPPEPCASCGEEICTCPPIPTWIWEDKQCRHCGMPWYLCTCPCNKCGLTRQTGCHCRRPPPPPPPKICPVCGETVCVCSPQLAFDLEVVSDGEVVDVNIDGRHVSLHIINALRETLITAGIQAVMVEQNAAALQECMRKDPMSFMNYLRGAGA